MFDIYNSQYFKNLPKNMQETISQSGRSFQSEDDLRKYVANMQDR